MNKVMKQIAIGSKDTISKLFDLTLLRYPLIRDRYISSITRLIHDKTMTNFEQLSTFDPYSKMLIIYHTLNGQIHGPKIMYSMDGYVRFFDEYLYGEHIGTVAYRRNASIKMITTYDSKNDTYSEFTYNEKGVTDSFYRYRKTDGSYVY